MCTRKTVARLYKDLQLQMSVFYDHETVARQVANDRATLYDRCTIIVGFHPVQAKLFGRTYYRQERSMADRGREARAPLKFFSPPWYICAPLALESNE